MSAAAAGSDMVEVSSSPPTKQKKKHVIRNIDHLRLVRIMSYLKDEPSWMHPKELLMLKEWDETHGVPWSGSLQDSATRCKDPKLRKKFKLDLEKSQRERELLSEIEQKVLREVNTAAAIAEEEEEGGGDDDDERDKSTDKNDDDENDKDANEQDEGRNGKDSNANKGQSDSKTKHKRKI